MPGCVKLIKPTTMTLNKGLLYHLVNLETCRGVFPLASYISCSVGTDVMLKVRQCTIPMYATRYMLVLNALPLAFRTNA
jgi:hypothetical protein